MYCNILMIKNKLFDILLPMGDNGDSLFIIEKFDKQLKKLENAYDKLNVNEPFSPPQKTPKRRRNSN